MSTLQFYLALEEIDSPDTTSDKGIACGRVTTSARDDVLWSIGQRDVMAFDGAKWGRKHLNPIGVAGLHRS